ncbi:MAG: hypothetical protein HYV53_00705 [Parcubacteria group bacterium]|nr:hypothetical protein [Parcubacteria group bacterium]
MFDELDKQNTPLQPPAPVKTEDIFSQVDKTVKPEPFRPRDPNSPPASGTVIPAAAGWLKNKPMVFSLIFGGLLVVLAGGYFGLKLAVNGAATVKKTAVQEETKNNPSAPAGQVKTEIPNLVEPPLQATSTPLDQPVEPPKVSQPIDTDQDGLTDEEEARLGANANNPDTDGDGLTDREEAKVYGTDPLKADTDGDGYADGAEIKNNYNPNGQGKLYEIK